MRNFSIYTSDPDTLSTFPLFYPDRATAAPRHYVFYDFICPPRCSPKKSPEPRSRTGFCTRRSRRSFAAQQKYREANKFPKLELLILSQHQLLCCSQNGHRAMLSHAGPPYQPRGSSAQTAETYWLRAHFNSRARAAAASNMEVQVLMIKAFFVRTLCSLGLGGNVREKRARALEGNWSLSMFFFRALRFLPGRSWTWFARRNVITFSYLGSAMSHELVDKFSFVSKLSGLPQHQNRGPGWGSCLDLLDISLARCSNSISIEIRAAGILPSPQERAKVRCRT